MYKKGDRVGAIMETDAKTAYLYGFGVYDGDIEPSPIGRSNPRITLDDNRGIVWGFQCWWGDELKVKKFCKGREIVLVPVPESNTLKGV